MTVKKRIGKWLRKNALALVLFALSITYTTYLSEKSKNFQISLENASLRAQEYIQRGGELPDLFCNPHGGVSLNYPITLSENIHFDVSLEVTVIRANGTIEKLS